MIRFKIKLELSIATKSVRWEANVIGTWDQVEAHLGPVLPV